MAFPYTYKKRLDFVLDEKHYDVNISKLKLFISKFIERKKSVKSIKNFKEKISFISTVPILNFEYSTDIFIKKFSDDLEISYEVNLEKLLTIVIIVVVLTAFFSFVSVKYFLILAGVLSLVLYGVFYLVIDNTIQNFIKRSVEDIVVSESNVEKISNEQVLWINDENRCSACGNYLSEIDLHCSECGIKLKRSRYTIPLDVSKYKDKQVSYHFKKKE